MKRRPARTRLAVQEAVARIAKMIANGIRLKDALKKERLSQSVWQANRPEGTAMRRTSEEVDRDARRVQALVQKGASIEEATKRIGLKRSVYALAMKRLKNNGTTGSVRADMLPPRPEKKGTGKGGYQKLSVPPDMNSVQSLAQRIGLIDKKLDAVKGLSKDRKTYAKRLMELLRKGA
jgi:hypothetical protein